MDQFRQIGEVLGSLKALMVFQNEIQINQRQCCFLLESLTLAYETIADEMRSNLRFEDKPNKWKVLEQPLKELCKIFQEVEAYIRNCFENRDWWAKALTLCNNRDSVEFHIHNLLTCIPIVIEAVEIAGELSSCDEDEVNKRRVVWSRKYHNEWNDPKLFRWKFGKQYLVSDDFCNKMNAVCKEDRWILLDKIRENRIQGSRKDDQKLIDLLVTNLDEAGLQNGKLLPCSILTGARDYQVRKRLGSGGQHKEISWLGESFALRHIKGEIKPLIPEISQLSSLSHPNILHILCSFKDEENTECFLVTELMSKNLYTHVREFSAQKKRAPPALPIAVDMMLQIARGMEYLHSKEIYHGNLNPSNILVKARSSSSEGFVHVKVAGFGLSSATCTSQQKSSNTNEGLPFIWHSPEVLALQEESKCTTSEKYTEKSDVYSFSMICFELLTGKVPFEDGHLQGDNMGRNILAGERPLFPFHCPKYMVNVTRRCWHYDPNQRPSFSSICRILRYIKRFLVMYPDQSQPDASIPLHDYCDLEMGLLRKFPYWVRNATFPVPEIPFQMFAYRVTEKEKCTSNFKDTSESGSEGASISGDDTGTTADDIFLPAIERKIPVPHESTTSTERQNPILHEPISV